MFIENAVETAKIAVDSCYVLRQFLTPLPSIDFREIRGLAGIYVGNLNQHPNIDNDLFKVEKRRKWSPNLPSQRLMLKSIKKCIGAHYLSVHKHSGRVVQQDCL
jgi:hypothetical protein